MKADKKTSKDIWLKSNLQIDKDKFHGLFLEMVYFTKHNNTQQC